MGDTIVPKQEDKPDHPRVALSKLLESQQDAIVRSLPKHLTPERMMRVAQTAISKTPALWDCAPDTIISSVVAASQLGLEINGPLSHASLVPFRNRKTRRLECQLMVEYRGYIELADRADKVEFFDAQIVYEGDLFEFEYGTNMRLKHVPSFNRPIDSKPIAGYALVQFKTGVSKFVVLPVSEIEEIRACSRAKDGDAWKNWWDEMAKKTCIRRLVKYVSLSAELTTAANLAESMDAGVRAGEGQTDSAVVGTDTSSAAADLRRRLGEEPDGPPPPSDDDFPPTDADGVVTEDDDVVDTTAERVDDEPADEAVDPTDPDIFGAESKFAEKVNEMASAFEDLSVDRAGTDATTSLRKWQAKVMQVLGSEGVSAMGELDQKGKNAVIKSLAAALKDYEAALDAAGK